MCIHSQLKFEPTNNNKTIVEPSTIKDMWTSCAKYHVPKQANAFFVTCQNRWHSGNDKNVDDFVIKPTPWVILSSTD
jgi:hypothetical protein